MDTYPGITADSLYLLAENRFHDSKPYYEERKLQIRRDIVEPLKALVADLSPALLAIDPLLVVNPNTNGCVSRVRRDTRFSSDKSLYRENMWVAFLRDKKAWDYCLPAFYLDFSSDHADWGMGFYNPRPALLTAVRKCITADQKPWLAALKTAGNAGFRFHGEPYARPRCGDEVPPELQPLYNCRSIDLGRSESPAFVAHAELPETLRRGFAALAPLYRMLMQVIEQERGFIQEEGNEPCLKK